MVSFLIHLLFENKKIMKKITLLLLITFLSLQLAAQENEEKKYPQDIAKKYELKLNAFSLIGLSSLDVSYEKLINSESSYGVALFYNFSNRDNDNLDYPKKFSITPYYRWFFSETRYARGFFVEGFGMLNTYEDSFYNFNSGSNSVENQTAFALGISVGGKFVTKSGFTTEVYLGLGRNLLGNDNSNNSSDYSVVGRGGISLGYRF